MSATDKTYLALCSLILSNGADKSDRTGTGTYSLFGPQMTFNLEAEFPLLRSKSVSFRLIVAELLWMLSGSTNVKVLQEEKCHIWDEWADGEGNLGPIYGQQWRSWGGDMLRQGVDQISEVIHTIKTNPDSRRMVVSAWNVADIPKMNLPPCHALFQFYVEDRRLSCKLYQRSADMFLGVPFNIASYALLTQMIANECDLGLGQFIWSGGDCHIYKNHILQVLQQTRRFGQISTKVPVVILPRGKKVLEMKKEDILLLDYHPMPAIKGEVAV